MKKLIKSTLAITASAVLMTGCATGQNFSMENITKQLNKLTGIPNTKEEFVNKSYDKHLAEALSFKLEDISTFKPQKVEFSSPNIIKFEDERKLRDFEPLMLERFYENDVVKNYISTVKERGNKTKVYNSKINSKIVKRINYNDYVRLDMNTTMPYQTTNRLPVIVEFNKNNEIVSILSNYSNVFFRGNNPSNMSDISIDATFILYTGMTARIIEHSKVYKELLNN